MRYDVLIIGGGFAGNYLARLLAGKLEVAVVERKGSFGGKACTGIIGAGSFEALNLPEKAVINGLRGAVFHSAVQSFEVSRKRTQAYVVDRRNLERELAKEAIRKGADYFMATNFLGFRGRRARLSHLKEEFEVEAKFYVGADGVASTVAREIGSKSRAEFLRGYELEVLGEFRREFAEVWVNKSLNKEFFLWVAPLGDEVARVGTFGELSSLERFLRLRNLKPTSAIEFKVGVVGLGWREPWVRGNTALLGDAALQIKPTTAGGIVFGAICAHHLARAILSGEISSYEHSCRAVRRQISFGLTLRRVFLNLTQEGIEGIFRILSSEEARRVIEEEADFDDHLRTFKAIAKRPRLLAGLLRVSPSLIRALL